MSASYVNVPFGLSTDQWSLAVSLMPVMVALMTVELPTQNSGVTTDGSTVGRPGMVTLVLTMVESPHLSTAVNVMTIAVSLATCWTRSVGAGF